MEGRVHAVPRAEHVKMQACHRTNLDPTRRCVPSSVNAPSHARLVEGPETFQGPHCPWVPEHGPRREFADPDSGRPPCRVWYHRPIFTLPTAPQVSRPEDLVTSQAGNRPLVEMRLHSWDGPLPFQTCRDPRHSQLHLQ